MTQSAEQVTVILRAVGAGEVGAQDRLYAVVYEELRRVASNRLAREGRDQTLDATGLVHETFLRLVHETERGFANRLHFFSAAAESMRRILIDRARKRRRLKRGGDRRRDRRIDVNEVVDATTAGGVDLLALDEALQKLEQFDPRKSEIVKLRYFLGLTTQETADVLGIATRTIDHEWRLAKAWLRSELQKGDSITLRREEP
ncbi:MAG: ECF-type sigma factor [Planctomycetota bacterium]